MDDIKERSRQVWSLGDYEPASRQLEPAAEALIEALQVGPDSVVLDVAAGHGNCAIAAARRGAAVTATDWSPTMIERGSARTRATGLDVTWQEADAADLPFESASFDKVTSTFGAIFAMEQEETAAELLRVTRPGGLVGMTAWTPNGLTARVLAIGREYAPPRPAGVPDPFRWGSAQEVAAIFEPLGGAVTTRLSAVTFRYDSWDHWRSSSDAHGMSVVARQTMDPDTYAQMRDRMQQATAEFDQRQGDAVAFDSEYLEIIVRKEAP